MQTAVQDHPLTLKLAHQANMLDRDHTALHTAQLHAALLIDREHELGLTPGEKTLCYLIEEALEEVLGRHASLVASINQRKEKSE